MDTPMAGIFLIAIRKCPSWDITKITDLYQIKVFHHSIYN